MFLRAIVNLLLVFSFFGLTLTFTTNELRVTLSNGSKLIGRYLRAYSGRPIRAFTNVPYAKPPVGDLRFKDPQPLEKWNEEYLAIDDGPVCPQRNPFTRSFVDIGDEDCLRLNVYVPHSYDEKLSNLSVMVHIHGGGFVCSSGNRDYFGPEHFLDHNVILVTGNYRLGALGFLSTEDENCPGNFGLKDQVMILKWVQANIKQFGGNPDSVTIFGGSVGGASVTYLMASPLAQGLFSKGIASSGTDVASFTQSPPGMARMRATQLAEHFNCLMRSSSRVDWSATINCLRNIPAKNMSAVLYDSFEHDMDPKVVFTPVVEPKLPGAFITEHPRDVMPTNAAKIPFLTGLNYDEGLIKSAAYFNLPGLFEELTQELYHALPIILYYNHYDLAVQNSTTDKIKAFYFQNNITRDKEQNLTNLFGDELVLAPMDMYLHMRLSQKEASPTYVYLLTHKANISYTAHFGGDPNIFYGVSHHDETMYLFPTRMKSFPKTLPTKGEEQIRETMVQMWVDFAQTGNPTPESSQLPKWNNTLGFPISYYRIGNYHFEDKPMFGMEAGGLFEDRAQFWREIHTNLQNASMVVSLDGSGTINFASSMTLTIFIGMHFIVTLFPIN